MKLLGIILLSFFWGHPSHALMEYGSASGGGEVATPQEIVQSRRPRPQAPASSTSSSSQINLALQYNSLNVHSGQESGKVEMMKVKAGLQTVHNIFLEASYWQGRSADEALSLDDGYQAGNPLLLLGFNWLKVGQGADAMDLNLYGGVKFGASDSTLGHSRTDKILGVQTTKRFQNFVFGLSYQMNLTGSGREADELKVGNMRTLKAAIGWAATMDIRFALEAYSTKVSASQDDELTPQEQLTEEISFAALNPKLLLLLGPGYELELGASFRSNKASSTQNLVAAQLFNEPGSYGTSVYAGLNFTL